MLKILDQIRIRMDNTNNISEYNLWMDKYLTIIEKYL
jgi:hypothetical protein